MRTSVRAHRILKALENYEEVKPADEWSTNLCGAHLGQPIGCYRNPEPQGEVIGIFTNGLAWPQGGRTVDVAFSDVVDLKLPTGKKSEGIVLKIRDDRQLLLPVRGQRGKFFDSMEMLRFLRRVMEDLHRQGQRTTTESGE